MTRPPRVLLFSTLYPSQARPGHGIFVETRLRELLRRTEIQAQVVAPVPWFPSTHARWGEWALMAATPARELRHGVQVEHPRYLLPPKVGMTIAPLALALAAVPTLRRLKARGFDFDLIDAHYYYPDGVAAALLATWFKRPLAITARGSDLNLIAGFALPRRWMQWAAQKAVASIGVCEALVDVLRTWKIDDSHLHVMRNGVDLDRFAPMPREQARQQLGLTGGPWLISVGNLVPLKGHDLVLEALKALTQQHPHVRLAIIGRGPERERLERLAQALGVLDRVTFTGALPQSELTQWYGAADALVLASSREGMANVLLECMACGTPVVATAVGGTPEIVTDRKVGRLVAERTADELCNALIRVLAEPADRAAIRQHAETFGWSAVSLAQARLFQQMMSPAHA